MNQLRSDLQRAWVALDKMPANSLVTDRHGIRWRLDGWCGYWYPVDTTEPERSSFQLAQLAPITEVTA